MKSLSFQRTVAAFAVCATASLSIAAIAGPTAAAAPAGFAISDASIAEGDTGTFRTLSLAVVLDAAQPVLTTVSYSTAAGTANTSDFGIKTGTLNFKAGFTTQYIALKILADTTIEGNESFVVNLSNPIGAGLDDDQGTITILEDDDTGLIGNRLVVGDIAMANGDTGTKPIVGRIALTLSEPAAADVIVELASAEVSASVGTDYKNLAGLYGLPKKVKFLAGQYSKFVAFTIYRDTVDEPDETFTIYVVNVTGAQIQNQRDTGIVTIVDDDN